MAGSPNAAYNADMSRRQSWGVAAALSLIAASSTLIPYWLAAAAAKSGLTFSGFLINPQDGFSYLAKMRQGASGSWGFLLPYAADPGAPAFLFVHYLTLGYLARLLGAPMLQMYHAARLCGTLLMYLAAYGFFELTLEDHRARWGAFSLALFGSGLGWLGLLFGFWGNDLLIPEAIPWFSALANAHFPWACAAVLGLFHAVGSRGAQLSRRVLLAGCCALTLAFIQPFALLTPTLAALAWQLLQRRTTRLRQLVGSDTARVLGGALLSSLPILLYDLWITQAQPALHLWSIQNRTPAPPLHESGLGFGLPLLLATLAIWKSPAARAPRTRLLLVWFAVGLVLVYLPFNLQRRMLLGLFFPLVGLAGLGLGWLAERRVRPLATLGLALALGLPSNVIVAGAGVIAAARGDPSVVLDQGVLGAYRWLDQIAAAQSLVLAGPLSGNRLPAYADVRVLYGHPFETPDASHNQAVVETYFRTAADPELTLQSLHARQVDYVLYGPEERQLGMPDWLQALDPVFAREATVVYRVPAP